MGKRVFVQLIFSTLFFLLFPFIILTRRLVFIHSSLRNISIWTGAPIITMPKKCLAERSLGFKSFTVVPSTYFITNDFDIVLDRITRNKRFLGGISQYISFFIICILAKQVHAFVDGGILTSLRQRGFNYLELVGYHLLGIKLFIWTYGADVRTKSITRKLGNSNCCTDCIEESVACICNDKLGEKNYDLVKKFSTRVFSMGDMIEYTPGSDNSLFFWPVDIHADGGKRYSPVYPTGDRQLPLKVIHAPNHRAFKGTGYLIRAIEELRTEGLDIELTLIEKMPNDEAMKHYRTADVIFDQCMIGFHGYFALEAMALGKPVMCFIRKPNDYLLHPEECPMINTNLLTIKADLRNLAENRNKLPSIGRSGRLYIEKYFTLEAFSNRLDKVYQDL